MRCKPTPKYIQILTVMLIPQISEREYPWPFDTTMENIIHHFLTNEFSENEMVVNKNNNAG